MVFAYSGFVCCHVYMEVRFRCDMYTDWSLVILCGTLVA